MPKKAKLSPLLELGRLHAEKRQQIEELRAKIAELERRLKEKPTFSEAEERKMWVDALRAYKPKRPRGRPPIKTPRNEKEEETLAVRAAAEDVTRIKKELRERGYKIYADSRNPGNPNKGGHDKIVDTVLNGRKKAGLPVPSKEKLLNYLRRGIKKD